MKLLFIVVIARVVSALAVADANGTTEQTRPHRRLSYERIAGYSPGSQVTDQCAIDLDQRAIETHLALRTDRSVATARAVYNEGGHSRSYAAVSLGAPLAAAVAKGAFVLGRTADGDEVAGVAHADYAPGTTAIGVRYATTDLQASYVQCQVGALPEPNLRGCLAGPTGELTIDGTQYSYTYSPDRDNKNARTIAAFSTKAKENMRVGCRGCPFPDFQHFYNYYGRDDYAHHWVESAFDGARTDFVSGNADFSRLGVVGREEAVRKGTAYLHVFMQAVYELERAAANCDRGCINCNESPVHEWDKGVCYYAGSIEGRDGAPIGLLLHQLADDRCQSFKTCGVNGSKLSGMAKLNYDVFNGFAVGNFELLSGNCPAARATATEVIAKMYVPLIQGALLYAFKLDQLGGGDKENAEGAVFAAAVLPRIHAASPRAARIIYENMSVGTSTTSSGDVKLAFESTYAALGISCADVGGLWDVGAGAYHPGMAPCAGTVATLAVAAEGYTLGTLAIALICTFAALSVVTVLCVCNKVHDKDAYSKEEQGESAFSATQEDVRNLD